MLLPVCHLDSPPHCTTENWFGLPEKVSQYSLGNSVHEAAAAGAYMAHRPRSTSSCGDSTFR